MTSLRLAHESGITREVDRAAVRMTETLHHDSRTSLGGHTMKTTAPREDLSQIGAQARTDEMGAIDRVLRLFKSQGNPHAACRAVLPGNCAKSFRITKGKQSHAWWS